jgi:hypothetical protein
VIRAGTAERDANAGRLRTRGLSYDQIAKALGFRDRSGARRAVQRALATTMREPADELCTLELERLDDLTRHLQRVLTTRHYAATASGEVARHLDTSQPLADDGPAIAVARELRQVSESRRRLLGLDQPQRHEVRNIDAIDARLLELADQVEAMDARTPR